MPVSNTSQSKPVTPPSNNKKAGGPRNAREAVKSQESLKGSGGGSLLMKPSVPTSEKQLRSIIRCIILNTKRESWGKYIQEVTKQKIAIASGKSWGKWCSGSRPSLKYNAQKPKSKERRTTNRIFNKILCAGKEPSGWKEAEIIPLLKDGKDPMKTTSYRPVALT